MEKENIFAKIPKELKEEFFENILLKDELKIERIVSYGHTTEESKWYDQNQDEWVIVLQGAAIVSFENKEDIKLKAGDYINIPAHKKHRVSWTIPNKQTIWLALHY